MRASSALWAAIIVLFSKRLKRDVLHSGAAPFASSTLPLGNPSVPTFFDAQRRSPRRAPFFLPRPGATRSWRSPKFEGERGPRARSRSVNVVKR